MNPLTPMYSVLVSIWAILFLSKWRSRQMELTYLWGAGDHEDNERPRKQFLTDPRNVQKLNEFSGEIETVVPIAVDETVVLLHPPLPLVGVLIGIKRGVPSK